MPSPSPGSLELLVFADSHGNPHNMLQAIARHPGAAAYFHLGDGAADAEAAAEAFPALPLYAVGGNCDPAGLLPQEGLAPFGGLLLYYVHGNGLGVKRDLDRLWWAARQRGADAALFGHTHIPCNEERDRIRLFNPGSITRPRFGSPSYGLITIAGGRAHYAVIYCK